MKKKIKNFFITVLFCLFFAAVAFYVSVSLYYDSGFSFGTWINGHYCTGLSVVEVNDLLIDDFKDESLDIIFSGIGEERIKLSDIDYAVDYTDSLEELFIGRNRFKWIQNVFAGDSYRELQPEIYYDKGKLKSEIKKLEIFDDFGPDAIQYSEIRYDKEHGYTYFERLTDLLDYETLCAVCDDALNDSLSVTVSNEFFCERTISDEIIHNREIWDEVSKFISTEILYDMGDEEILIAAPVLSTFIDYDKETKDFKRNPDDSLYIDESRIYSYIDDLCNSYYTYRQPRVYTTFSGDEKKIDTSVYGTEINVTAEEKYFYRAVHEGISERHIPSYIHKGFSRGLNDIGDTFIEVDLTNQKLLYVVDGEVYLNCDIVSGKPSGGNATKEVLAYVIKKATKTYLRGSDYVSYVNYWMPFYGGNGFHDASWQKKFGGDRYLRYGSHGCINMRLADVKVLYEKVEVGTPVIVYK